MKAHSLNGGRSIAGFRRYSPLLLFIAATSTGAAHADTALQAPTEQSPIKRSQPTTDTLVLTAADLDNGHARLSEALAAAVPAYTSPLLANRGASSHARVLIDRGLSPDQLLILVNGERRYKSAIAHVTDTQAQGTFAVDLDAIPLAAIDRIEISRASGSVRHGSAGAAGVMNIILKKRRSGGDLYADFSQHTTEVSGVSDVTGADTAPGVIGLTTAGDRNPDDGDGDTLRVGGSWGFAVGETGSFTAAASYLDRKRTSREGYTRGQLFPLTAQGEFDQREITTERLLQKFGDADTQELNFSIALEQQVHGMTFNLLATYAARTAKSFTTFQRPLSAPETLLAYPEGYLPEQTSDSDGLAVTFQLAGQHFGWNWLATYHQGEDELDWTLQDSVNLSLVNSDSAEPIREFLIGNNESRIQELSFKADRGVDLPFAQTNTLAFGLDYQLGDHEIERGDQASFIDGGRIDSNGQAAPRDSQQVPGIRPRNEFDEGRTTYAAYAELSSVWQPNTLSSRLGVRYNDYDDIGTEVDVSAGLTWQALETTRINLDLSRGHRAPDMGQRFYNGTFIRYFDQTLTRVEVLGTEDPVAQSLGARALDAENSLSANLSARYEPNEAWRLHATLSWLDIEDRVVLSDALDGIAVTTALQNAGIDAQRAAFYTNGVDTDTLSLDVGANYRLTLSGSHIDFGLQASAYRTSATAQGLGVSRRITKRLEDGGPGTKVHFTSNWQRERTSLAFNATWYGSATHAGDTPDEDHRSGDGLLLDLILNYQLTDEVAATFGGLNLFDAYPDELDPSSGLSPSGFEQPFSNYTPWGFNGRSVFLSLRAQIP